MVSLGKAQELIGLNTLEFFSTDSHPRLHLVYVCELGKGTYIYYWKY